MGLDWCLEPKTRPGREAELEKLKTEKNKIRDMREERYKAWLKENGHKAPHSWPNPITDAFHALPETMASLEEIDEVDDKILDCVITPSQTMGAPKIRIDEDRKEVLDWLKKDWESRREGAQKGAARGDEWSKNWIERFGSDFDKYWSGLVGRYIPALAQDKDMIEIGTTWMFTSPTDFRGKIVGRCEHLPEEIQNEAYADMDAEALLDYGKRLEKAAKKARRKFGDEVSWYNSVLAGAKWCQYWGSHGHSMHAWY